jgi:CxxC-x17-CxxC domain-containing protein
VSFADKTLTCVECGSEFIFSAGEQEFHAQKGFTNEPRRCPNCRANRRAQRDGYSSGSSYAGSSSYGGGAREFFSATCASCGREARVPFQPRGDRPVYCSDCFRTQQASGASYGGSRRNDRW